MNPFEIIAVLALGYLLGSVPFAVIVARRHGVDILSAGSGNPGATNVKRVVGKRAGNLVFLLDFIKGLVAAGWPMLGASQPVELGILGLLAAIAGHSFSCFLGFRGGKGVATTMGGLLALSPWVFAIGIVTWLIVFRITRYVVLASIAFAAVLPIASLLLGQSPALTCFFLLVAVLVLVRHRGNLHRLRHGTEPRYYTK